jgi:hypothetical protein
MLFASSGARRVPDHPAGSGRIEKTHCDQLDMLVLTLSWPNAAKRKSWRKRAKAFKLVKGLKQAERL